MVIDYTDFEFVKVLSISLYVLQDFFIKEIKPWSVYGLKHKTDLICALQLINIMKSQEGSDDCRAVFLMIPYLHHFIYFFVAIESRIGKIDMLEP